MLDILLNHRSERDIIVKVKTVLLIGIMLLLTACSGADITSEIYLVDIDELEDTDGLTTYVFFGLPISDCVEETQTYQRVFRKSTGFRDMEFMRCYTDGYNELAEYRLKVPMRLIDPHKTAMQGTFEIIRHDDNASNTRNLYIRSNPKALCNLDKLIRDEFYQSLDLSDVSPLIFVTNDLREPQTLIVNQVFVNGSPVIEPTEIILERRDSIRINLSNVTVAWTFSKSCNIVSRTAPVAVWVSDEAG